MECYDGVDEWKKYENKNLGLEAQLPANWNMAKTDQDNDVTLYCGEDDYRVSIEISKNVSFCKDIENSAFDGVSNDRKVDGTMASEYFYSSADIDARVSGSYIRFFREQDCWLISHLLSVQRAHEETKSDLDYEVNAQQGEILFEKSKPVMSKILATVHTYKTAKKKDSPNPKKTNKLRRP